MKRSGYVEVLFTTTTESESIADINQIALEELEVACERIKQRLGDRVDSAYVHRLTVKNND